MARSVRIFVVLNSAPTHPKEQTLVTTPGLLWRCGMERSEVAATRHGPHGKGEVGTVTLRGEERGGKSWEYLREGWRWRRDMEREGRRCHVERVGLRWQHGMKRHGQGCRRGMEREEWGDRQEGEAAAVTRGEEGGGNRDERERAAPTRG